MSVIWERFAGQTDRFAVRLAMITDPHAGDGATPAESASWGALQIWVHGQNLCAHTDQGELLGSAHWYLLPLLDWVAENWNPLLHEEKLPNSNSAETAADGLAATRLPPLIAPEAEIEAWEQAWFDWRSRHAIRSARAGGLLPNVVIRRFRDQVEVSWNSDPDAGTPAGFQFVATTGSRLFEPTEVAAPLYDVVASAVSFLVRVGVEPERLDALTQRLRSIPHPDDQRDERSRWMAGFRTDRSVLPDGTQPEGEAIVWDERWNLLVSSLTENASPDAVRAALGAEESDLVLVGASQASLLFSSVSPTVTTDDVRTLSAVLTDQFRTRVDAGYLDRLARDAPMTADSPAWEQGYELAEDLLEELHPELDLPQGWVDVERLIRDLGVDVVERKLHDSSVRACSLVGPSHSPTIVHNTGSPYGTTVARRFTLAHELCHLLYDRSVGAKVAIASGPWAPRAVERRANAFAAMFLMPNDLVRSQVATLEFPVASDEGVAKLASTLRVSKRAAIEHLFNLSLLDETARDRLLRLGTE